MLPLFPHHPLPDHLGARGSAGQVNGAGGPKLLDRVRWHLRVKHYSIRTEQAYVDWARRCILFHRKRHPREMGEKEITEFLTHLAVEKNVAASTQNQAFSALLFLYQQVLEQKLDFIDNVQRVARPAKLPVVFTRAEAHAVLGRIQGEHQLMADLLYGSGLRLMECVRLRVKDIDFGYGQITVRDGKGLRQRVTLLPHRLRRPLQLHLAHVRALHQRDLANGGVGSICLSPWNANIAMPIAPGRGSMFSPPPNSRATRARTNCVDITFQRKTCRTPSNSPSSKRAFPKQPAATRSGTVLPRIFLRVATTSVQCRSFSDTRTYPPL